MTYKEAFMECTTMDELLEKVKKDIEFALLMGSYARVKVIKQAAEEVIAEKFSEGGVTDTNVGGKEKGGGEK